MKIKLIAIVSLMATLVGCSSDNDFKNDARQLRSQGYTNIKNTGYNWFCCGEDDSFSTGFSAVDKNGILVKGCFCSGIGKGITIRFE